MIQLLIEAIIVGIMTVIFGTIIAYIMKSINKIDIPPVCQDWNKNYTMEIALFLTGFSIHLFCELTGLNKWYCRNGYACLRK